MRLDSHRFSCTDSYSTSNSKRQICYYVVCVLIVQKLTIKSCVFIFSLFVFCDQYRVVIDIINCSKIWSKIISFVFVVSHVLNHSYRIDIRPSNSLMNKTRSCFADSIRIHKKLLVCQANVQKSLQCDKT